jgi:hypothetical protein
MVGRSGYTWTMGQSSSEKDWTAPSGRCQPKSDLRQTRRRRLAVVGISARLSGVWARSSPEAAKRGVRDAGLEVGYMPRDHRSAVWSFIASDMSDRSSAGLYSSSRRTSTFGLGCMASSSTLTTGQTDGQRLRGVVQWQVPRGMSERPLVPRIGSTMRSVRTVRSVNPDRTGICIRSGMPDLKQKQPEDSRSKWSRDGPGKSPHRNGYEKMTHVLIATPTAGGIVKTLFASTLVKVAVTLRDAGWNVVFTSIDGPSVSAARNYFANLLLRHVPCHSHCTGLCRGSA